ncbi:MAG TPA: peptide chain release factor N(5)-glutamine methyltransferase [Gammaproteobacteria bacterium]
MSAVAYGAQTLGTLADWGAAELGGGDSPRLDAELLLAHAAGLARSAVIAFRERGVDGGVVERYRGLVARRAAGEPLAYLLGRKEFFSLELAVTPDVLVPRPETEVLVERALDLLPPAGERRVLDLGTGSGAIALAIKHERPRADVTAADASAAALAVARANGERLGLAVRFVCSDWFEALAGERFELIACNPPYVRSTDPALAHALRFEPREALDGGPDGLAAYRAILGHAAAHLAPGGHLLLEHGHDQQQALVELARSRGFETEAALRDYAGHPRVVVLRGRAAG